MIEYRRDGTIYLQREDDPEVTLVIENDEEADAAIIEFFEGQPATLTSTKT